MSPLIYIETVSLGKGFDKMKVILILNFTLGFSKKRTICLSHALLRITYLCVLYVILAADSTGAFQECDTTAGTLILGLEQF